MLALPSRNAGNPDWVAKCAQWKGRFAVAAEPHDVSTPELNYYEVCEALSTLLISDEIIVTDAGSAFYTLGQAYRIKEHQRSSCQELWAPWDMPCPRPSAPRPHVPKRP